MPAFKWMAAALWWRLGGEAGPRSFSGARRSSWCLGFEPGEGGRGSAAAERSSPATTEGAAAFWGFRSSERAKEWGKRRLRCSGFSSARELGVLGAAAGSPRRRRGGGRETVLGGVAKGGSSSARGAGSRSSWGRHVKRRRSWIWPGASQRGGGRRGAVGGEREQRGKLGMKTGT